MAKKSFIVLLVAAAFCFGFTANSIMNNHSTEEKSLKLGAFSLSLNVKDLQASKQFYELLGFRATGGDIKQNYLIMKNENTIIGIFNGYFEGHMLTFNPGWDENAQNIGEFDDVRVIQQHLKKHNINLSMETDETTKGPGYIMLSDPDSNMILIDQHR